jgi:hypothetical protein
MVHPRLACAVATGVLMMATSPSMAEESNKLIGTWKLISAKYGGRESNLLETATTLKHITPVQMIWLSYDKDGKMTRAGGGRYTFKDDEYTDTPEYGIGDFSVVKGQTPVFKCKLEGNKWYHDGKLASGLTIEEVWERVEK